MALHALKKFGHLFMKESELRDVLLEIDEVRREWSRLIKQQKNASQAIDKWCAHQSPHITEFMHGIMASEAEYNAAAYHFLEGQAKYQACWSSILTERSELIEIKNQLKVAEKNARKAEKKLAKAQPDDLPKVNAEVEVARTELARLQGKFRDMTLFAQQGIETDLRSANYSRSEEHMKFLQRAAFCEERILRLTHTLQRTETLNENGSVTTQPFAAAPGPMKDPIWHHGEELNAMLNNDGRFATAMAMSQKRARETLLESDLNYIQEASGCFKGDFVDFFMVKCRQAQVAVQETPVAVMGKDETAILEIVTRLSHAVTMAIFSGFGIVQILDAKERKIFWDHIKSVSDNSAFIFYRLVSGAESGISETSIQPPCDKLNESLSAIMTYVDSVCLTSGMRDDLKRDSNGVRQSLQQSLKAIQSLHDKVPRDSARSYDVNDRLLYSGEDCINQSITLVEEVMKFQTVMRETRVNITQEEYSVIRRDWDRVIDSMFNNLQTIAPTMSDSFRRVVTKGQNYEELLISARTLSTAPAQLETFLQVTDFEDEDARDELVGIIQSLEAKSAFLIAAVNESQTEYLSHAPVEDFERLSGEQAKSLLIAAQANVLRIQNELSREQQRIDRLTRVQQVSAFGVIPSDPVINVMQQKPAIMPSEANAGDNNISRPFGGDSDNSNTFAASSSLPQKDFSEASNASLPCSGITSNNNTNNNDSIFNNNTNTNTGFNSLSNPAISSTANNDLSAPLRPDIARPQNDFPALNSNDFLAPPMPMASDGTIALEPNVSYPMESSPLATSSSAAPSAPTASAYSQPNDDKTAVPHNIWDPIGHSAAPKPVTSTFHSDAPVVAAPRDANFGVKSSAAADPILAPPSEWSGQRS